MQEGREAVQRRARLKGLLLSDLDGISEALGHDPLLIALHEPGNRPQPERVIEQFIDASAERLATLRKKLQTLEARANGPTVVEADVGSSGWSLRSGD
jgi:hypothetical protein